MKSINPYKDVITFGKYKGEIFDEIAEKDPNYIIWLSENVKTIKLPQRYIDAVEMDVREEESEESEYLDAWGSWMSRYD
jgi:hypothetical protein